MPEWRYARPLEPASHRQFPLFDSLRALAAIAILLVHVAIFTDAFEGDLLGPYLAHLDIGVPFFFLLSAFLLYRPFVSSRILGTPRTGLSAYATRRFTRIVPAYWFALTIAAIVPGMLGIFSGNWWVYYGLLQDYPIFTADSACVADPLRCGLPQTWSLAVEVAFYALLPLYALALDRLARRRGHAGSGGWVGIELGAVLVLAAISIVIQSSIPTTDADLWLFYSPLGRGWWFGLGLALAALSVRAEQRERDGGEPGAVGWIRERPGPLIAAAVALYVGACAFVLDPTPSLAFPVVEQAQYLTEYVLFGVIAALVLLPAAFGSDGPGRFRRALRHRSLTWLGLVSYGIFLWQFPVIIALVDIGILDLWPELDFLVLGVSTLLLTVACAAVSYYGLERPLMRRVRRMTGGGRGSDDRNELGGSDESRRIAGADDVATGLRPVETAVGSQHQGLR